MRESFTCSCAPMPSCHHSQCDERGIYRAPKDRSRLQEYYWFCLKHVQAYNRQWDYYVNMTPQEIEASRQFDSLWESPTNPLQVPKVVKKMHEAFHTFKDPRFSVLKDTNHPYKPDSDEAQALKLFQLPYPFQMNALKKRYKELVKKFHPDVLMAKSIYHDDKMKRINHAYQVLKKIVVL